jgi:hypothetical protein
MPKRKLDALEHLQLCSVCDPAKEILTSKFSYLLFFFFFLAPMKEYHCKEKETTGTAHHPVLYFFWNPKTEQTKTGSAMDGRLPIANRLSESL